MEPPKKRKFLGDEDVYSSSNAVVRNGGAYAGVGLESAATVRGGARRTITDNSTTTSTIISSNNIGTSKVSHLLIVTTFCVCACAFLCLWVFVRVLCLIREN